jgi:hypothetical protein
MSRSTSTVLKVSCERAPLDWVLTSQIVQCKGIDFRKLGWVLPVVLNDVDIVRGCQKPGEGGDFRVPQGR